VWVDAGRHRLLLQLLDRGPAADSLPTAAMERFTLATEGCTATSDGAGFILQGTLHDIVVTGDTLVIQYRADDSAEVLEQAWTPEAGKIVERLRPAAGDKP
jgi:hypothetical protein